MSDVLKDLSVYIIREEAEKVIKELSFDLIVKRADALAVSILDEIKHIISENNQASDFEIVENIVSIFEKYNIDCNGCHDFG